MKLKDLLTKLECKVVKGDTIEVSHLQNDSRKVKMRCFCLY